MTDRGIQERAAAEVRRRVAEGRADGRYPEELDAQLASQFVRAGKDPLLFERLEAARAAIGTLRGRRFSRASIVTSSELPGGSIAHRAVAKLLARQIDGVLVQMDDYARDVDGVLEATLGALDEIRSVIDTDLFGDIDVVHHRLVSLEHELARRRSDTTPDAPS